MTIEAWALLFQGLALIPAYGAVLLIWHGIRVMSKNAEMRAADSERKHEEVMSESARRHEENMTALNALIEGQKTLIERHGQVESPENRGDSQGAVEKALLTG